MVIPNLPTVVRCPPLVVPPTLNSLGSQRRLEHGCPNHETVTVSGVEVAVECVEESCGNWEAVVWCSRVGSLDTFASASAVAGRSPEGWETCFQRGSS